MAERLDKLAMILDGAEKVELRQWMAHDLYEKRREMLDFLKVSLGCIWGTGGQPSARVLAVDPVLVPVVF